jgi:hypothetical protein
MAHMIFNGFTGIYFELNFYTIKEYNIKEVEIYSTRYKIPTFDSLTPK